MVPPAGPTNRPVIWLASMHTSPVVEYFLQYTFEVLVLIFSIFISQFKLHYYQKVKCLLDKRRFC